MHREVSASQIMYALNASVVGLAVDHTPYEVANEVTTLNSSYFTRAHTR